MKITDEEAKEIAGHVEFLQGNDVERIASVMPPSKFFMEQEQGFGWAGLRCRFCLGPIRKVIWCLISQVR